MGRRWRSRQARRITETLHALTKLALCQHAVYGKHRSAPGDCPTCDDLYNSITSCGTALGALSGWQSCSIRAAKGVIAVAL
jgi:hypothetical protein